MRRCVLVLLVILVVAGLGRLWKPENIIVKYDEAYGGDYLTNALEERWPECYVECYDGDSWNSFISALQGAEWDMCIVAAIYCSSYDTSHYDALLDYYNEYEKLFFFDIAMEWGYSENLVEAMGGRFPETWYFMSTHYEWDSHRINRGLPDEWPLDRHDWSLTYWTVLFDWTTAQPITGWSMFEFTRGYAGILIAPNYYGVLSGLYPSLMFTQEEKLWDNICFYIWLGDMEMAPPYVDDMYPDDGRRDVPLDTQIVFHCMDDEDEGAGIDVSTILFSVEASESRSEKALEVRDDRGAAIKQQYAPSYEITGTLEIDDDHLQDVVCTFTPDEDLPVAEIVCTVDETLADRIGLEMGYDEVWTFYTEGYEKVEEMSWGAIKALY